MFNIRNVLMGILMLFGILAITVAHAAGVSDPPQKGVSAHGDRAPISDPNVFAPYEFLIGEWDISADSGPPTVVFRFSWGPNRSYIWCSASLIQDGKEQPHFEGMLVWNALKKNLDMLFVLGLEGPGGQEQGSVFVDKDGTVIREIMAPGPQGTGHFRQTFKRESPDRVITTVLRETKNGWVPTFPGSDHLIMSRRLTTSAL